MDLHRLGKSELLVSKLCFGSLTISPLQRNFSVEEAEKLLLYAFEKGINFIDTAALYNNYHLLKGPLHRFGRERIILSTKSYAYSRETGEQSLKEALEGLNTDYIDLFMLHEQESEHTLRGHQEAIDYFIEMKNRGIIKSFGISTHFIEGVKAASQREEIDVIHPIINYRGIGIVDGSIAGMLKAVEEARKKDIGIYAMKALGGGHLLQDFQRGLEFVLNLPWVDSIAVGMQRKEEVDANRLYFHTGTVDPELVKAMKTAPRMLHIADWCSGCGECVKRCQMGALSLGGGEEPSGTTGDGKVVVDPRRCVFCGYCASVCPDFCIKVI